MVSRVLGVPRETVRDWRRTEGSTRGRRPGADETCPLCGSVPVDAREYAYLLGLYLGDGCLSKHRRGVYRLRISLDARYPRIVDECARSMAVVVRGRRIGRQRAPGCLVVSAYWRHWICLFPQHGPGRKHSRRIELAPWQGKIARAHPDRLLRGLVHSDGCRVANRVRGKVYPRYMFSNRSTDVLEIFCRACEDFGVSWTRPSFKHISVARAADVARLDAIVEVKE